MQQLTSAGQNIVNDLAQRYNLSQEAVIYMLGAVNQGGGSMAQFNCPELGGSGQWMRGGMTMVGDMFNNGLKATVDNLCNELSNALANTQMFPPAPVGSRASNQWWPGDLGSPSSSGAQNNIRYAVFPNRLAIELNGQVTVYDTLDNNIGGVSQQQGGDTSLTFSSQYGTIAVDTLPIISGAGIAPQKQTNFAQASDVTNQNSNDNLSPANTNNTMPEQIPEPMSNNINNLSVDGSSTDGIIALIEKIAKLHESGALTDDEFNTKKSELLSRI
ncbi:SHOCT domain-containing protein [Cocleimonas sp. KMM 6892]|uniref:SHOCT domain-containing protein n=1 Tax=unclassified Cocleimonas TaxID=2639732 RepID=UPI002DBB3BC7|nr:MULTISPECIES: SHOCT domain-containing protein [unclassified Cocleimonas]MEB8432730.1 SHOCT domain-containing protein [Cocleimonas sp. KMM 6892]MEC4715589.1 SHOCT domain-containing protein [Cocleimonas sp. KMM 6895]MEC4744793.1 SHOCT domain-containing protein [Cocleimonas sp. KMM 6896]